MREFTLRVDRIASPIGEIVLATTDTHLVALDFADRESWLESYCAKRYGRYRLVADTDPLGSASALKAYLAGDLAALDGVAVDPGGTPFQNKVWLALREIPPGSTDSYGALAARLGAPKAVRAVGRTNNLNPIAIVLPCHRVIGADQSLTGYAGGLHRKHWLLRHEGALLL
jgi:methylated-DNA-[protein]-cysteine S-methyltransferase